MAGTDFDVRERVRASIDIVELIGRSLELRRQGRNFVARCPWHDDRRPSLQVNPDRQSWKCWVCNIGGDVFSFVMQREGIGFGEALRMLADQAGIPLNDGYQQGPSSANRDEKQRLYKVLAWAAGQFRDFLAGEQPEAIEAREYLRQRGLSAEAIEEYQLGYAPDQWSWLIDRGRGAKIATGDLETVGLVSRSESSGRTLDRFRGRVMFPIRDTQRRPIAFGGRVLPRLAQEQEDKGRSVAKYINSPETKLFSKSDVLYGLDTARDEIIKQRRIVVMEGYTDVMMAWQHSVRIATAVLGTALNERHMKLIRRFADQVVLLLDGDAAGQRRANEVLDLFVGSDLDLRILTLPSGLDPCDYLLAEGGPALLSLIDAAPDALDHKLRTEFAGFDPLKDTHRAFQAAERVLNTLAHAPRHSLTDSSARLREQQILTRLARSLAVPDEELRRRLEVIRKTRRSRHRGDAPATGLANPSARLGQADRRAPVGRPAHVKPSDSAGRSDGTPSFDSEEPWYEEGPWEPADLHLAQGDPTSEPSPAAAMPIRQTSPQSWPTREIDLIEILLLAPDQIDLALEKVPLEEFIDPTMRAVYGWIEECYQQGMETSFSNLLTATENAELKSLLVELDERASQRPKSDLAEIAKWLQQVLQAFDKVRVDRAQQQTLAALASHQLSQEEEEAALLRMLQEKQREQELRRPESQP